MGRCLAACGASAASGVVLPFRLDYVVKISLLRRLGGVRLGLGTIGVSIVALGMVDAVAMLPLALAAVATSGHPSCAADRRRCVLRRLPRDPHAGTAGGAAPARRTLEPSPRCLSAGRGQHAVLAADARGGPAALGLLDVAGSRQHPPFERSAFRSRPRLPSSSSA